MSIGLAERMGSAYERRLRVCSGPQDPREVGVAAHDDRDLAVNVPLLVLLATGADTPPVRFDAPGHQFNEPNQLVEEPDGNLHAYSRFRREVGKGKLKPAVEALGFRTTPTLSPVGQGPARSCQTRSRLNARLSRCHNSRSPVYLQLRG
ncbi:hypothetical protein E4N62_18420 [Streptomyces sp. MNU76]|uniref:hypothetical protein n=1 Tax=Streptomyces sp. MNU76 TaxID=2560026 RepID=UPI001E58FC56|nr:hypothetical protein [Streptomyces sp. MNU76]MCC9707067.1 hypothetical protein [Streptomyces sp. MNU76]